MKIYTSLVKMRKQFAFNFFKNMSVDIKFKLQYVTNGRY